MKTTSIQPLNKRGMLMLCVFFAASINLFAQTASYDSLTITKRVRLGASQSLIIDGLWTNSPYNHIYTKGSATPTHLLLQSQPSPANYNTIINARNTGKVAIGTLTPATKFHLHSDEVRSNDQQLNSTSFGDDPGTGVEEPMLDENSLNSTSSTSLSGPVIVGPVPTFTGYSDFLMTNSTTGSLNTDGLLFSTSGNSASINLQEAGALNMVSAGTMNFYSNAGSMFMRAIGGNTLLQGDNIVFRTNNGGTRMYINSSGFVGIGTSTPASTLDIVGNAHVNGKVEIGNSIWLGGANQFTANNDIFTDDADLQINCNPTYSFNTVLNANSGKVIIGNQKIISGPHTNFKLSVNGKMVAKEIYVTLTGWADYVFAEDYKLMPLNEVEQFIMNNNHLPNVPSEKEVLSNGSNLGEMDAVLLRKIEELTLYLIDLEKKNQELSKKIETLQQEK